MYECGTDDIAGGPVHFLNTTFSNTCGSELFQFPEGERRGFLVRLNDTPVIHRDRQNRNALWRRTNKVKKDSSAFEILRRQLFVGFRVLVIAQFQECLTTDDLTRPQSQPLSRIADPMSMLRVALGIVIIVGKVFVEIRLRRLPILLWDTAKHTTHARPKREADCS